MHDSLALSHRFMCIVYYYYTPSTKYNKKATHKIWHTQRRKITFRGEKKSYETWRRQRRLLDDIDGNNESPHSLQYIFRVFCRVAAAASFIWLNIWMIAHEYYGNEPKKIYIKNKNSEKKKHTNLEPIYYWHNIIGKVASDEKDTRKRWWRWKSMLANVSENALNIFLHMFSRQFYSHSVTHR